MARLLFVVDVELDRSDWPLRNRFLNCYLNSLIHLGKEPAGI